MKFLAADWRLNNSEWTRLGQDAVELEIHLHIHRGDLWDMAGPLSSLDRREFIPVVGPSVFDSGNQVGSSDIESCHFAAVQIRGSIQPCEAAWYLFIGQKR